jgi:hypothetical protein
VTSDATSDALVARDYGRTIGGSRPKRNEICVAVLDQPQLLDETDNAFPGSGDQLRVLTDGNRSPLLNF